MWLCHTFFCTYYFSDIFVAMRYPVVMYVALVAVSWLCGHVIKWLHRQAMTLFVFRKRA